MPGDPWLIALEDAIYSAPEGPTDDQLILFANALNSQGFFEESLELSEYLEHRIPVDDSYRLTEGPSVQIRCFSAAWPPGSG